MGYLALMRPLVCLAAGAAAFAGTVALDVSFERPFSALLPALSVFLLMGAADAFNDYFDRDIDRRNAPHRPIPSGRVSPRGALVLAAALAAAGNAAALAVNARAAAAAALLSALYAGYGVWSKKLGFVKNLVIAVTGAMSYALPAAAAGRVNGAVAAAMVHCFFMMLSVEVAKDVEDMTGDSAEGARTWALSVGGEAAGRASAAFAAAGILTLFAAGAAGVTGRALWPFAAAAAALAAAGFVPAARLRAPTAVLCASALGVAGLVLGTL
jgi:geranylgeranylglycerol-phosphate geranylgeranyltransferase